MSNSLSNDSKVDPPPNLRLMAVVPSELPRTAHGAGTDLTQNQSPSSSLLSAQLRTSRLLSPPILPPSQSIPRLSHPFSTETLQTSFSVWSSDVLFPRDIVRQGIPLQAEPLRLVPNQSADQAPIANYQESAREFEVVRKIGTGSCAIVYLVREILFHFLCSEDDHVYPAGHHPARGYGREYAIKLLSKSDLNEEELTAQLTEVSFTVP